MTVRAQSGRVAPTPTPTPPDDTLHISTEEIKLNVLAFDENGDFFRDVNKNDLVITEDNILHQPSSVRRIPANVVILLDTGGELRSVKSLAQTRRVAEALVGALRPEDSVAILQYADKAEVVGEWTSDKDQSLAAIKRTNFGRRSAFVDGLTLATNFLVRSQRDNKHLVLITDGTDSAGKRSAKFDAMQRLLTTDISVHVLSYTGMEAADIQPRTKTLTDQAPPKAMPDEIAATLPNGVKDPNRVKVGPSVNLYRTLIKKMEARQADLKTSEEQLDKLAENTNGEFVLPAGIDEMIDKTALVAKIIDASYVVTYTPKIAVAETRGVAERHIEVTSKRPGLVVVARRKLLIRKEN